jgi:hypothetical protein
MWSLETPASLGGTINSVVRDRNGVIYLPVDGAGGTSVLFASNDEGKTWTDTGGRTAGRHTTLVLGKDGAMIGFGGKKYRDRRLHAEGDQTRWREDIREIEDSVPAPGQRPEAERHPSGIRPAILCG